VQLASEDSTDLSAKLYLSSKGAYYYPRIPPVATVMSKQIYPKAVKNSIDEDEDEDDEDDTEKKNKTASVELWWNPALYTEDQPAFLLEYCLVVSERRHYRDNCLHHKNVSQQNFV